MSWYIKKIGTRAAVKKLVQEDPYLPASVKAAVAETIHDTLPDHAKNMTGISIEGNGHVNNNDGSCVGSFNLKIEPVEIAQETPNA